MKIKGSRILLNNIFGSLEVILSHVFDSYRIRTKTVKSHLKPGSVIENVKTVLLIRILDLIWSKINFDKIYPRIHLIKTDLI